MPEDEQQGDGGRPRDPGTAVPPGSGRARELARGGPRRRRTAVPLGIDTGRRHHIGDAPAVLSVLRPDGSVGTTRTSPVQLRDRNDTQLIELAAALEREMHDAARDADYERAAHLRDELAAARHELERRSAAGHPRP